MLQRKLDIINKLGLHARASAKLTQAATAYASEVWLERNGRRVNAKSIMGVMMLAAGKGATLVVDCDGADADAALQAILRLIADKWVEYYWPLIESPEFIPQKRGEKPDCAKPMKFRAPLARLVEHYRNRGGLAGFTVDYRSRGLSEEAAKVHGQALSKVRDAIREGPVYFAGGGGSGTFRYDSASSRVEMAADLWRELSLMGAWIADATVLKLYPDRSERIGLGAVTRHGDGTDLAIVTFGNGVYLSSQAQRELQDAGIAVRVIDLHWLAPLPEAALLAAIAGCGAVLIVDETRRTGGIAEGLMSLLHERSGLPHARITATDSFIATGPAYAATMPAAGDIVAAAIALVGKRT